MRFFPDLLGTALLVVSACGGEAASAPPPPTPVNPAVGAADAKATVAATNASTTATAARATLERSPESGKVDRVGPDDGALRGDGVKDLAFVTEVEGPVAALFLVSVDEQGKPSGQYQADTLIGETVGPAELGARPGGSTSGIGVAEEGNRLLNRPDGAIDVLRAGPHRLTLYVAATATLKAGVSLRLYLLRPDRTLVGGAVLKLAASEVGY